MRVACAYTDPHPLALASLTRFAPEAERRDVSQSSDAYYLFLSELWASGEGFVNIEQDIEIREDTVRVLTDCSEPYCLFPYSGPGVGEASLLKGSLGCVRFSPELLRAQPGAMSALPVRNWRRLDCELHPRLVQAGYEPHLHYPPVLHHHYYSGVCACGTEHGEYAVDQEGRYTTTPRPVWVQSGAEDRAWRYRYIGPVPVLVPPLGHWVEPNDEVTTRQPITHPHFVARREL